MINILKGRYENPIVSGFAPSPREKAMIFLFEKNIYIYSGVKNGRIDNDLYKLNLINLFWEKVEIVGIIK